MSNCISRRSGFTLIELLIVIGIIGILAASMMSIFGGASDSAQASRCMTNMRNLATAVHSYAMSEGYFPCAGSFPYRAQNGIHERIGWISWVHPGFKTPYYSDKKGRFPRQSAATSSWRPILAYEEGNESAQKKCYYAVTNGVLWKHSGQSYDSYVCPLHQKACKSYKITPMWSYFMNSYFGSPDSSYGVTSWIGRSFTGLRSVGGSNMPLGADKVLLFAEVPFAEIPSKMGNVQNKIKANDLLQDSDLFDPMLRYDDKSGNTPELIGFNHKSGKRYMAHVAFADGHVSQLALPPSMSSSGVRDLTTWLCQGDEVAFDGKDYTRVSQADPKTK